MTNTASQLTSPTPSAPSRSLRSALAEARGAAILSLALFGVGVLLRLYFYADRRSLWLDEVWVAHNIVARSFLGLLRPLDYAQSAPVGFLWAERLGVIIGGINELALRAFPLLAGCLLLVAFWMLARRLIDVRGAAVGIAFAALSPLLIYYSTEVKPYISDALVTVVLTWLTLDVLEAPDSTRAWRRLAVGGVLAILFSTPSVFVLAAVGIALVAHPAIRGSRAGWTRLLGTGALWGVLFVVGYLTVYRSTANSDYMQLIWKNAFLSLPPRALIADVYGIVRTLWTETLFGENEAHMAPKTITIVALLTIIGIVSLTRRHGVTAALLLLGPFVVVGIASFARLWPMTQRLLLFIVPTLVLLVAAGLSAAARLLPQRTRGVALAAVAGFYLIPAAIFDAHTIEQPRRRDDVAPLIREFWSLKSDTTLIYVMGHGAPSWLFYTAPWKHRTGPVFQYAMVRAGGSHPAQRECIHQEPGVRTVFGGGALTDSSLAVEAAWIAAQPERDVWLLNITYESDAGARLDRQMLAHGATRALERSREGADLRRYRFPSVDTPRSPDRCMDEIER